MEGNNVTIPLTEYKRLISMDAKVQSLIAYINREKFSIERDLIGAMLGFSVNTRRDADGGQ